jgi:hypothetical protein
MSDPDLEGLLEEIGIRLGRSTDEEVYGYCPGHRAMVGREDRRPTTWSVRRKDGAHYCFSCDYGGTLAELITEHGGGSYWSALGTMRRFGIDLSDISSLPDNYFDRKPIEQPKQMPEEALAEFSAPPLAALRRRHIDPESAEFYGVRWDPSIKAWILPIRLVGGALLGWQAKSKRLFDNYPAKVPKRMTLFGAPQFDSGTTAILVESPLDVPRLHTAGFLGGLSAYGVSVHEEQMRLLFSLTDEVMLALDNDDAGRAETHYLITGKRLTKARKKPGIPWATKGTITVFNYGDAEGKDPGELTDDEIEWGVENAIRAIDWEA